MMRPSVRPWAKASLCFVLIAFFADFVATFLAVAFLAAFLAGVPFVAFTLQKISGLYGSGMNVPVNSENTSLPPLDPARHALREHVMAHAVKRGDFTLKSGRKSSWFLDTKQTACRPDGIVLVTNVALSFFPAEATAIGGLTMGADPVAYGVAAVAATRSINLRSFSVRKESKDHGVTGRIAGALQPGDKVIITEDTVTRGTSLFEAVDAVRDFGAEVVLITVIVDRGGTCAAMAADAGIRYEPMLVAPDLGFEFGS